MSATVTGLVLAAGAGSRLGTPKALVSLDGVLLPVRAAQALRAGGCASVTVVLGACAAQAREALADADVDLVEAPDWEDGLSASLRAGLAAVRTDALVTLADQPGVTPALVARLLAARAAGLGPALVAGFDGRPRNPVLLAREVHAEVAAAATGDSGARAWLRAHPGSVHLVECADVGSPDDIDTPQDLAAARTPHPAPPTEERR